MQTSARWLILPNVQLGREFITPGLGAPKWKIEAKGSKESPSEIHGYQKLTTRAEDILRRLHAHPPCVDPLLVLHYCQPRSPNAGHGIHTGHALRE